MRTERESDHVWHGSGEPERQMELSCRDDDKGTSEFGAERVPHSTSQKDEGQRRGESENEANYE